MRIRRTLKSDNYNCLFSNASLRWGIFFSASSALKYGQHNRENSNGIQIWSDLPDAADHIISNDICSGYIYITQVDIVPLGRKRRDVLICSFCVIINRQMGMESRGKDVPFPI